jgi:hypothetical protein
MGFLWKVPTLDMGAVVLRVIMDVLNSTRLKLI